MSCTISGNTMTICLSSEVFAYLQQQRFRSKEGITLLINSASTEYYHRTLTMYYGSFENGKSITFRECTYPFNINMILNDLPLIKLAFDELDIHVKNIDDVAKSLHVEITPALENDTSTTDARKACMYCMYRRELVESLLLQIKSSKAEDMGYNIRVIDEQIHKAQSCCK